MTITKKETKKKTSASASSSSTSSTKVTKTAELFRSTSGVQIEDISDNTGTVVTYKLNQNGGTSGGETITTYHKADSGDLVTQTISYPAVETGHYEQHVATGSSSTSQKHSTSKITSSNIKDSLNTTYTITEPKDDTKVTRRDGESAWNGKFILEKPIQRSKNPIVESSSTSSETKKSSSIQKSSSSSYVIEIVDGKERIIDSKHHESSSSHETGSEEHASARFGTNITPEAHYSQKVSDKKMAYDSSVPELVQPKMESSDMKREYHMVGDHVSTSTSAVSDNNFSKIVDKSQKHDERSSSIVDKSKQDISSSVDKSISTSTGLEEHKSGAKLFLDSKIKASQDFINQEKKESMDQFAKSVSEVKEVIQDTSSKTKMEDVTKREKVRSDTHWDGTFVYEKPDSSIKRKQTTSDSRNFFGPSDVDYSTESNSTYIDKGTVVTEITKKNQGSTKKDFYDSTKSSLSKDQTTQRVIDQPSIVQTTQKNSHNFLKRLLWTQFWRS